MSRDVPFPWHLDLARRPGQHTERELGRGGWHRKEQLEAMQHHLLGGDRESCDATIAAVPEEHVDDLAALVTDCLADLFGDEPVLDFTRRDPLREGAAATTWDVTVKHPGRPFSTEKPPEAPA